LEDAQKREYQNLPRILKSALLGKDGGKRWDHISLFFFINLCGRQHNNEM